MDKTSKIKQLTNNSMWAMTTVLQEIEDDLDVPEEMADELENKLRAAQNQLILIYGWLELYKKL